MGPSLSWYRKSYYLYYMSGASAIYLEQGFDQFFKPGPGDHEFQLNPLGRITEEFMRCAEKHPNRGTPYTPVAFLLDPAHGWDMTDYPQWPFEVSQINRSDRALRELFGVAYYPGLVMEGEPATADRQAFVNGIFGDIFDVLVASDVQGPASTVQRPIRTKSGSDRPPGEGRHSGSQRERGNKVADDKKSKAIKASEWEYEGSNSDALSPASQPTSVASDGPSKARGESFSANRAARHSASSPLPLTPSLFSLNSYRAIVVGGRIEWSGQWLKRVIDYVESGGTVVLNSAQTRGISAGLLGVRSAGVTAEGDNARCLSPGEPAQNLSGQMFRYEKVELKGAQSLIISDSGDPLVTVNKVGKGAIVFCTLPDFLGEDERVTPFAAHMLAHVFTDAVPIKVNGDVEYLVNRTEDGWVVTLFNNKGVFKPQQGLAQVDRAAYVTAGISVPGRKISRAQDWLSNRSLDIKKQPGTADSITMSIAPGGIAIVEIQ